MTQTQGAQQRFSARPRRQPGRLRGGGPEHGHRTSRTRHAKQARKALKKEGIEPDAIEHIILGVILPFVGLWMYTKSRQRVDRARVRCPRQLLTNGRRQPINEPERLVDL